MTRRATLLTLVLAVAPMAAPAASYVTEATPFNYLSTTGHATITTWDGTVGCPDTAGDDSLSLPIALPFPFRFGTTVHTQVRVMSNGRLQFNNTRCGFGTQSTGPPRTYPEPIPDADLDRTLRIYGADLDDSGRGTITVGTSGTAPNRRFVVTWNNVPQWNANGTSYNLQIQLAENGDFYFMYGVQDNTQGSTALGPAQIAWQLTSSDFVVVQSGLPANNSGWRFRPSLPLLSIAKVATVVSDPVNGMVNPRRIPGSLIEYAVTVANLGPGAVDADTVAITDVIPADTDLWVSAASGPPVVFVDGAVASGLSFSYPADVGYSSAAGGLPPYTYLPVANAVGVDPAARGLRIAPRGILQGATVAGNPGFVVRFRVRVR